MISINRFSIFNLYEIDLRGDVCLSIGVDIGIVDSECNLIAFYIINIAEDVEALGIIIETFGVDIIVEL